MRLHIVMVASALGCEWVILLRDLIDMPSRQHIRLSVKEIERLFERATFDADTLDSLIHELDHRSVHRAKELRQRILAARQALNVEVDLQTEGIVTLAEFTPQLRPLRFMAL